MAGSMLSDLLDAVRAGQNLRVTGGGSKPGLGHAVAGQALSVSCLRTVISYEPAELILVAQPGLPLEELKALLSTHGQALAFDPPDLGPLYGQPAGGGTLGGVVATGLSGPGRVKAGAVRDHVLGMTAIAGDGRVFRSGGKVVKNVTGFDLPKLLTGAHGTLGIMTEIVVKVLPSPPVSKTLVLAGIEGAEATRALADALGSAAEVGAAAFTPSYLPLDGLLPDRTPCVLLRLDGVAVSVAERLSALEQLLHGRAAMAVLAGDESTMLWAWLRDAAPLAERPELDVWRLSVPPMAGMGVLSTIRAAIPRAIGWLDWGGGLIWLGLPGGMADAGASVVRGALGGDGHATLMRAPDAVKALVPVFQPLPGPLAALTARVKAQFDPAGILNPGLMGM
ncbi:2-hydroxy-acid oxidase [Niveispirillum lacus]|uniref:2-hydroxy-acid oxidase n=1 Tax=Niveispirillum lacus TaxID=1981099 RepID=A0A255Z1S3_9PROT|nr:FAD-binding protein [Niveispirillum lacus]OYQ34855.1 2-hydroxy-acid oxidase [Niveispirillum lacus]